jgi:hypothetical protein
LLGNAGGCFRRPGKEYDTGYGPIQTMDKAKEDPAWFVVSFLDIFLGGVQKGDLVGYVPLDENPGRLMHRNEVVVLIKNFQVVHAQEDVGKGFSLDHALPSEKSVRRS